MCLRAQLPSSGSLPTFPPEGSLWTGGPPHIARHHQLQGSAPAALSGSGASPEGLVPQRGFFARPLALPQDVLQSTAPLQRAPPSTSAQSRGTDGGGVPPLRGCELPQYVAPAVRVMEVGLPALPQDAPQGAASLQWFASHLSTRRFVVEDGGSAASRVASSAAGLGPSCSEWDRGQPRGTFLRGNPYRSIKVLRRALRALDVWMDRTFLSQDPVLGAPCRRMTLMTDASFTGWGAVMRGHPAQGLWSGPRLSWHINCLEMMPVFLGLKLHQPPRGSPISPFVQASTSGPLVVSGQTPLFEGHLYPGTVECQS
ncbi:uncharacterized protein LOC117599438, partial, partial [Tachysurus ichikawai]